MPRLRADDAFSHLTAATLWGMPLALASSASGLHVTSVAPARAHRGRGVVGHAERLSSSDVTTLAGLPVVAPSRAWAQVAAMVPWWDSVAAGDYLVTGLPFKNVLPLATVEELRETHRVSGARGAARRAQALVHIVEGPFSRPESLSNVLFRLARLPTGSINEPVHDDRGSFLALPDQNWTRFRVAYEYEGDHHRQTKQYRKDLARVESLVDHDWLVVKASADDLFDGPRALVQRVARRLARRGWDGTPRELPQSVRFQR